MTNSLEIFHLDIFSSKPFYGNPLAVIRQSSTQVLTTKSMQQVANWLNLSETTFLAANPMHPDADYSIRIFTTSRELPFAGHPTIGSCKAWLVSGGIPKNPNFIIQECGKGLIKLKVDRDIISFEAPELNQNGPLEESELDIIARGLGISRRDIVAHSWCDNGPRWRGILLESAEKVLSLRPNPVLLGELDVGVIGPRCKVGVIAPSDDPTDDRDYDFEVRAFCPLDGPFEDPVTGSLNAAMAQWLIHSGLAPREGYVVRQGTALGRDGRVYVTTSEDANGDSHIWIGGKSTVCMRGEVMI
jgi:PhzF family phenazine biosynthesis protein